MYLFDDLDEVREIASHRGTAPLLHSITRCGLTTHWAVWRRLTTNSTPSDTQPLNCPLDGEAYATVTGYLQGPSSSRFG